MNNNYTSWDISFYFLFLPRGRSAQLWHLQPVALLSHSLCQRPNHTLAGWDTSLEELLLKVLGRSFPPILSLAVFWNNCVRQLLIRNKVYLLPLAVTQNFCHPDWHFWIQASNWVGPTGNRLLHLPLQQNMTCWIQKLFWEINASLFPFEDILAWCLCATEWHWMRVVFLAEVIKLI